jgi:hypothetical protein
VVSILVFRLIWTLSGSVAELDLTAQLKIIFPYIPAIQVVARGRLCLVNTLFRQSTQERIWKIEPRFLEPGIYSPIVFAMAS